MTDDYTPGPWTCTELEDDDWPFCYAVKSLDCTLAYVAGFDDDEEEGEANAHLMAAAPELLEALEYALDLLNGVTADEDGTSPDNLGQAENVISNAIKKAKGADDE